MTYKPKIIMKKMLLLMGVMTLLFSCSKNFYGTYNTSYSKDMSAFFQIKLNTDNTVEKTEIHVISNFAKGRFELKNNDVVCYFDSSKNGFPPDTLTFKKRGKKLYFVRNEVINKKIFLLKQ
jgi:hypothetical protein